MNQLTFTTPPVNRPTLVTTSTNARVFCYENGVLVGWYIDGVFVKADS